jgi:hypothetical protein
VVVIFFSAPTTSFPLKPDNILIRFSASALRNNGSTPMRRDDNKIKNFIAFEVFRTIFWLCFFSIVNVKQGLGFTKLLVDIWN